MMEKVVLKSGTDFSIEQQKHIVYWNYEELHSFATKMIRHTDFVKQILELWMFVPCKFVDGVWFVLEEPKGWKNWQDVYIANNTEGKTKGRYTSQLGSSSKCTEYQQAKEHVLFEGFEIDIFGYAYNGEIRIAFPSSDTIEAYVGYDFELTESAKKQIGL